MLYSKQYKFIFVHIFKTGGTSVTESLKRGLILFYFLLTKTAIRISPPLTISKSEIEKGCNIIIELLNSYKD